MHFGLPLITAEIGTGTSFVNVAGETGLIVPPDDAPALRAAMQRIAGDDALRERLGAAAMRRVQNELDARLMVDTYCGLYRELCAVPGQTVAERESGDKTFLL
jgi:glycosyltransferase involved in cell wall biosynthesis